MGYGPKIASMLRFSAADVADILEYFVIFDTYAKGHGSVHVLRPDGVKGKRLAETASGTGAMCMGERVDRSSPPLVQFHVEPLRPARAQEGYDMKSITVAAQATVNAKIESQYDITSEDIESAVRHQSAAHQIAPRCFL